MGEAHEWERQRRRTPAGLFAGVVVAALVLLVVGGVLVPTGPRTTPERSLLEVGRGGVEEAAPTSTPVTRGPWTATPPAPAELGTVDARVWTGEEVLVVGAGRRSGAWTYNPATGSWRRVADPPAALDGGVWDGQRAHFVVAEDVPGEALEVASWERAADRWHRSPPAPSPPRDGAMLAVEPAHEADAPRVWVVGGRSSEGTRGDGLLLEGDRWTPLPELVVGSRRDGLAVWTGTALLVFGGIDGGGRWRSDGALLEPGGDGWRPIARSPVPFAVDPAVVWTGDKLLVWSLAPGAPDRPDGWRYDPRTDRWSAPPQPADLDRVTARAATGDGVLAVWGGRSFDPQASPRLTPRVDGVVIRLRDGASHRLPDAPLPHRSGALVAWTDVGLLVWGGQGRTDGALLPTPALPGPPQGPREAARLSSGTRPSTMNR